jgi:hypothetical protein
MESRCFPAAVIIWSTKKFKRRIALTAISSTNCFLRAASLIEISQRESSVVVQRARILVRMIRVRMAVCIVTQTQTNRKLSRHPPDMRRIRLFWALTSPNQTDGLQKSRNEVVSGLSLRQHRANNDKFQLNRTLLNTVPDSRFTIHLSASELYCFSPSI